MLQIGREKVSLTATSALSSIESLAISPWMNFIVLDGGRKSIKSTHSPLHASPNQKVSSSLINAQHMKINQQLYACPFMRRRDYAAKSFSCSVIIKVFHEAIMWKLQTQSRVVICYRHHVFGVFSQPACDKPSEMIWANMKTEKKLKHFSARSQMQSERKRRKDPACHRSIKITAERKQNSRKL